MSDTSIGKLNGIASYYKGTQDEILNIPLDLVDPNAIFVESNTGQMLTGIQIINIMEDNKETEQPIAEESPTVFGASGEVSDITATSSKEVVAESHVQKLSNAGITITKSLPSIKDLNDTVNNIVNKIESGLIRGARGYRGVQGPIGVQGVEGTVGTQGYIGTQGFIGTQGEQGPIGVQGPVGVQGYPGEAADIMLDTVKLIGYEWDGIDGHITENDSIISAFKKIEKRLSELGI